MSLNQGLSLNLWSLNQGSTVQSILDLVTNLVSAESVTKSRRVTKFMYECIHSFRYRHRCQGIFFEGGGQSMGEVGLKLPKLA